MEAPRGEKETRCPSSNGSNNWYIGIWLASISEEIIVWVANRESPAKNKPGVMNVSKEGNLGLFDAEGTSLLSSFDYPVDTLLPGMRFGEQQKFVGWKSSSDPAPRLFSFRFEQSGAKQGVLTWNNSVLYWESGTRDGKIFSAVPEMVNRVFYTLSIENTSSGLYYTYESLKGISRFLQVTVGEIQEYALFGGSRWTVHGYRPRDQCVVYGFCGAYETCNSNNLLFCSCVESFTPKNNCASDSQEWWFSGCVRKNPLNRDTKKGSTDEFIEPGVTLSDGSASSYFTPTKEDFQKAYLHNCSCTAFAFNSPSGICQIWSGDLLNMHNSESCKKQVGPKNKNITATINR
ncbi:hypothetical protein SUGI_0543700 [Cryptomeria japonica]|nr:hypothetical protein SUGI_0543700 [Cryptomeria japonica]